ncbi:hypothetical protein [Roseovarius sp. SYSU LYC5161]|uniref:hypothetical protein n=1 Tax=Roseovarius halophilus (ex Wu et al. 2025) TaxID=3376060 RepID=UPI00399A98BB
MASYQIDVRALATGDADHLRAFYIAYVNEFLSVDGMARFYGVKPESARAWIEAGRAAHETRCAADRANLPDVTTRDRRDMPATAGAGEIGSDDPRAEFEVLDSRTTETGAKIDLAARWAGWACAGSRMRWENGAFVVRYEMRDGMRGSRAFRPADADKAAQMFQRIA